MTPTKDTKTLCDQVRQTACGIRCYLAENALLHRLRKNGIKATQQHPIKVHDEDGTQVGDSLADLLVGERAAIGLKTAKTLAHQHDTQILGYLKAPAIEHGSLVDSGSCKFEIRKSAWAKKRPLETLECPQKINCKDRKEFDGATHTLSLCSLRSLWFMKPPKSYGKKTSLSQIHRSIQTRGR